MKRRTFISVLGVADLSPGHVVDDRSRPAGVRLEWGSTGP